MTSPRVSMMIALSKECSDLHDLSLPPGRSRGVGVGFFRIPAVGDDGEGGGTSSIANETFHASCKNFYQ